MASKPLVGQSERVEVERVYASAISSGDTVWVQQDRGWMTVRNISARDGELTFSRYDGSIAEFDENEWVLKMVAS